MPKTEVILTHNIVGLGAESDQVKVAAGYARNYLFPQGFAVPLTGANKRRIEALKQRRAVREAEELNHMTELSHSLAKLIAVITVKTGEDGRMFGSVTAGAICDQLKNQFDVALDKRKIHLEHPIRTLGDHEVELRLHADVVTKLKVKIESSTPIAAPGAEVAEPGPAEKKEHARTEKRGKHAAERAAAIHTTEAPAEKPERKPRAPRAVKTEHAHKSEKTHKADKGDKGE